MVSVVRSALALKAVNSTFASFGKCHNRVALFNAGAILRLNGAMLSQHRGYQTGTYFTKKHEYVIMETESIGRVGISNYAQEKLGDVVYVQLPEVGREVERDEEVAAVESVKAASEIYAPLSGTVTEVNEALESDCGLINKSALDQGWIFKISVSNQDEAGTLLSEKEYKKFIAEEGDSDESD